MAETQYFKSSLLAQQMEDTWTGTVRFNTDQNLSDSEKAQARENIGAVSFGSNLKILGHFDTVTELQASAPQNVGDAYSVGTATPYNLYIFDGLRSEWLNYGQIRAADISAQYVENQVIAVSAWTQDTASLAGYSYKAQITVSGATGDDFPIVAFNQSDAVSGNFAPLAFSFDGYLEIWAKTKPTAAVTIPIATIIVNGGNGRGITNATGGIAAGSIGTTNLADDSVTAAKIKDGVITRAKLAQDALYSPIRMVLADSSVVSSDVGATIRTGGSASAITVTLTQAVSHAMPIGAEIAFLPWVAATMKIAFDGVKVGVLDQTQAYSSPTFTLKRKGMIAIKKILSDSNGDYWLLSGLTEEVTT